MDLIDQILEAARVGETTDWEFKSARGGFPGSFWETYSAMANSQGGIVVLGASERDDSVRLNGLTDAQIATYQKTLWDGLNNRGVVSLNLLGPNHVEVAEVEGTKLLAVRIPRATRAQRPVHLGGNPLGRTWRRTHEGDYRCTDSEVRRMLADGDEMPRDQRIIPGFSLEDLDPATLAHYRRRLLLAKGNEHPWIALPDRDLLERLGGWRRDAKDGVEGLTLAGLLMFGKDLPIRNPEAVPKYFVDYREKLDSSTRWSDRIYPDGTWEPNLFQFYLRVWPKLAAGIPTPFRLEGIERRDVTPTHEALREAFINALIHADYFGAGGIVIERYPDRYFLSNPGTLLVSMEQYHRGGVSDCRNPALQQMFLLIGGGERAGSGTDKIRYGWRLQHWRAPRIETFDQPDRVGLTLPTVSLIPEEALASLRDRFGAEINTLMPAELEALATAHLEGTVSNTRLQELLSDHPVDITKMLGRLCERGLLRSDRRRRWTTYRLAEEGLGTLFESIRTPDASARREAPDVTVKTPLTSFGTPDVSQGTPDASGGTPDVKAADHALTVGADGGSREAISFNYIDDNELRRIAEHVTGRQRVPPQIMRKTIRRLCSGRFLSAEQLGEVLHRHPERLRAVFLTPMTRTGLLRLRFPEAPNRPDQAYTTAEDPE